MALVWLDSFDHYLSANIGDKWTTFTGGGASISAGNGRRGSAAALVNANTAMVKGLVPSGTTCLIGCAWKTTTFQNATLFGPVVGTSFQVAVTVDTSGILRVQRGATVLGTWASSVSLNTFYFLELKVVVHPSAGSILLRVNEAEVIPLISGINTANNGVAVWDGIGLFGAVSSNTYFDDLYVLDGSGSAPLNDLLGDCRVDVRVPTAEGFSSAWSPSSGSDNALMVDDPTPDGDTTYVSTGTINATDTHVVQDVAVSSATVYGVQLVTSRKKSDAGPCSIAPVIRHAGVDYVGPASNPGTTYSYAITPYGTNPGTGAAWLEADFNAAEFGYKRTA